VGHRIAPRQAVTRGSLEVSSFDADFGLQKFNPLLEWTNKDVWAYIRQNDVPYNKLHDQFYPAWLRTVHPFHHAGRRYPRGRWWWKIQKTRNAACM